MSPLWDPDRTAAFVARYRSRYLRRRAIWQAADRNPRRYRDLARGLAGS